MAGKHSTRAIVRGQLMDVLTLAGVLDADQCRRIRAAMAAGACEPAQTLNDREHALGQADEDGRRAIDVDVSDDVIAFVESCLDAQRAAIAAFFDATLSGREGVGFLRYDAGGFYGPHVDCADMLTWPDAARRAITIVLFLNSSRDADASGDFSGGWLRLFPNGMTEPHVDIIPTAGMLAAFPSCTPHEVTRVTDGRRDAVVDWFYG